MQHSSVQCSETGQQCFHTLVCAVASAVCVCAIVMQGVALLALPYSTVVYHSTH